MTIRYLLSVALATLWMVGCSAIPFQAIKPVPVDGLDPDEVRERFSLALPLRFRIVSTVTVQVKGRSFLSIGYTDVDTNRKTFTVVGIHPSGGAKLFELSGDAKNVKSTFILEEFNRRGDLARIVGEDTRRMYFDRLPDPDAKVSKEKHHIIFRQQAENGEIEYVFGGEDGVLVAKHYYEGGRKVWSTSYFEYLRNKGKLYPAGIILENQRWGYQLVVRLKEIRS
jgi:hypothetical protein